MREPDFEMSADMRLLELQRGALGLPPRERTDWEARGSPEAGVPVAAAPDEPVRGGVLAVESAAVPADQVIAGAVVTYSLSVANEGGALAPDVLVAVPLPGGAAYRPGSFVWNGRSTYDDVAENFFNDGLAIGALDAGERATFVWKVGVRLGIKPLVVAPQVRASGAAVLGAKPIIVGRKLQPGAAFAAEVVRADAAAEATPPVIAADISVADLPIYELDDEEAIVYEAADAALSTAAPPPAPPAREALAPEPEPAPAAAPAPAPRPAREAVELFGRFDSTSIAFFERAFSGKRPPTILQHCIFAGALACSGDAEGRDTAGLKQHLDAQSALLHRIVLHEKLGKKEPIAQYAGELQASLEALVPAPVAERDGLPQRNAVALAAELSEPTRVVIARIAQERERWDFVKARQLTLALQAQELAGSRIDERLRDEAKDALRAYAQASMAMVQKLFVRARIDRSTALLFQSEPALDAAATRVLEALKSALS